METGIIGLPLSGKTTIFNALTGGTADTSAHAGGKKQPNLADVAVPDERVDKLTELFNPKKKVYATVRIKDVQIDFTAEGGIAASSIADIRNSDVLTIVIRAFKNADISHPLGALDPLRDFRKFLDSMIFSDYEQVDKRLSRLVKEGKKASREYTLLEQFNSRLEAGEMIGPGAISEEDKKLFAGFSFLTTKPLVVVVNTGEDTCDFAPLEAEVKARDLSLFVFRGDIETEIAQLPEDEQREFLDDLGLTESARVRFLTQLYTTLNLISFLTAGEDEVRAWSIPKGLNAMKAAGKIHTDLEKGFIRAEVIEWQDLLASGGFKEAKAQGKLRLEGKEYIVKDGDVLTIRFNV